MNDIYLQRYSDVNVHDISEEVKEAEVSYNYYCKEEHMLSVIDKIINHSRYKFGLQKGSGQSYSAILTTSSIRQAQKYYKLFKEVKEDRSYIKISPKAKALANDFPKVAITYSLSENEDRSVEDQKAMMESISDYNEMLGTSFDLSTEKSYNLDLNKRIASFKIDICTFVK